MHLSSKSVAILISPFLLAGSVWFFSDEIAVSLFPIFVPVQQQTNSVVTEKGSTYQFITEHKEEYSSLLTKIRTREENRFWIAQRLYVPASAVSLTPGATLPLPSALQLPPPLLQFGEGNITAPASATPTWSVQMVLPQQHMAIINNRIYRIGQSIDGITLLRVESSKVYIQTSKGSQWVKLFH